MYKPLIEYKNKHAGQDIYILASGASMDFMPLSFFDGKVTIGLNLIHRFLKCTYIFIKDIKSKRGFIQHYNGIIKSGATMITVSGHDGLNHDFTTHREYIIAPVDRWGGFIEPKMIGTDVMVNSHMSITTAIHIAYYMGAKNIVLCGADGGMIDGRVNMANYYSESEYRETSEHGNTCEQFQRTSVSHPYNELNITVMRDVLRARGCNLISLNPFINLGMEGHAYTREAIPEKDMWRGPVNEIKLI